MLSNLETKRELSSKSKNGARLRDKGGKKDLMALIAASTRLVEKGPFHRQQFLYDGSTKCGAAFGCVVEMSKKGMRPGKFC